MLSVDDGCGWAWYADGSRDAGKRRLASLRPWRPARDAAARADWSRACWLTAHHQPDDGEEPSIPVPRRCPWPRGHAAAIPGVAQPPALRDGPGCGGLPAAA